MEQTQGFVPFMACKRQFYCEEVTDESELLLQPWQRIPAAQALGLWTGMLCSQGGWLVPVGLSK